LRGDTRELLVPPPAAPARADGLWRHLCFELFLKSAGTPYCEFNFSPAGVWAAYDFDDWRQGMRPALLADEPVIECERDAHRLQLRARWSVPLALVAALSRGPALLAPRAVIEDRFGLSWWALAHGPGEPDFHREVGFVEWQAQ
jgi:hypothetical protein